MKISENPTQTLRLFFAYFNHRFSGNHRFNVKHDSGKSVSNLAHGRSEAFFHPIPLPPPVTPLLPILPCAAADGFRSPPSPSPDARPTRVVRAPPRRPPPRAPGPPPWAERRPAVSVDLDRGRRAARAEVDGVRAASLPARHRRRVEGTRWQRDWKVSEAAARVLALPPADAHAVDAVLNCWAGRYARRNFPLLIRVCPRAFFLARAMYSMQ